MKDLSLAGKNCGIQFFFQLKKIFGCDIIYITEQEFSIRFSLSYYTEWEVSMRLIQHESEGRVLYQSHTNLPRSVVWERENLILNDCSVIYMICQTKTTQVICNPWLNFPTFHLKMLFYGNLYCFVVNFKLFIHRTEYQILGVLNWY